MIESGSTINGKYRVEHQIARGGMGEIYAATQLKLGIKVALKFLRSEHVTNRPVLDRFVAEAQAVAQLRSENVCRVADVDSTADGVPFIVMELLQGRDLHTILKTAPLDVPTATEYVLQTCLAIAEAHAFGVVHRDLKPSNLFLTYRSDGTPIVKVLDFGVAKTAPKTDDHGLTQTQTVIGSPGYMSPEQLRSSRSVDHRTDIWSFGVVLYELVVGRRPWTAEAITELTLKVANDPPGEMPAAIDRAFVDVVHKCLRKSPDERYQSVAALASALAPFTPKGSELALGVRRVFGATASGPIAVERAPTVTSPPPTGAAAGGPPTTLRTASGVVQVTSVRSKFPVIPAAIGAAIVIAIVAVVALRGDDSSGPSPAAAAPTVPTTPQPPPPAPPVPTPDPPAIAEPAPTPVEVAPAPSEPTPTVAPTEPEASRSQNAKKPIVKPKPVVKKPPKKPSLEDVRDSRI